jgi:septal ring factor EnvC (AmiA/AmiB activator)
MESSAIIIAICAAILSGMGTAIIAAIRDAAKEKNRRIERDQDHLKLDLKDLKIELYKIEKELTEWKDKYYNALQELIRIKAELEESLMQLAHYEHHIDELDTEF